MFDSWIDFWDYMYEENVKIYGSEGWHINKEELSQRIAADIEREKKLVEAKEIDRKRKEKPMAQINALDYSEVIIAKRSNRRAYLDAEHSVFLSDLKMYHKHTQKLVEASSTTSDIESKPDPKRKSLNDITKINDSDLVDYPESGYQKIFQFDDEIIMSRFYEEFEDLNKTEVTGRSRIIQPKKQEEYPLILIDIKSPSRLPNLS